MAITIDTTLGGATTNSYVVVATADAYLEARLNASTAWTGDEAKKAALVEAFRELNVLEFQGQRVTDTQAAQWPRQWAPDPDSSVGWYYATDVIPQRIKDAQCELALEFLKAGTTDLAALDNNAGVIEKTIDVLTTRWQPYARPTAGLTRFPRVWNLLRPLLAAGSASATVVRG